MLRCENPILAARARVKANGETWLECEALDKHYLKEWVERTVVVEEEKSKGWDDLREEWRNSGEDFARLHICPLEAQSVMFFLNFDHVITDGIGVRILTGRWLQFLAADMVGIIGENTIACWAQTLPPPWTDMMNEYQVTEGHDFEAAARRQWDFLVYDCVCALQSHLSANSAWIPLTSSNVFSRLRTSTAFSFSRNYQEQTRERGTKHTSALSPWKTANVSCNVSSLNSDATLQSHILAMQQWYLRCCAWKRISPWLWICKQAERQMPQRSFRHVG